MTYTAPYIDTAGLHVSSFQDVLDYLTAGAKSVYGSDIYLEPDSQDYQMLSVIARAINDGQQSTQLSYNSRSPLTAVGTGLDAVVAINGISRAASTYSTATVTLTGTPYTVISNGVVSDTNGKSWNLPESVTLDASGTANVTATAQSAGAITALAGQINIITTPTFGWTSVTNANAAIPGTASEKDPALKSRQALSVENPSQALTAGILGGVLAVTNVTQAVLYENDTNLTVNYVGNGYNPGGFPPHSITVVVIGGDGQTIANAIGVRKTPGCYSNGDQAYTYTDQYNQQNTIRFYIAAQQTIDVSIIITPLTGYTSAIASTVQTNVANYINSLKIGQNVVISELERVALAVNAGQQYPYFSMSSLTAAIHPNSLTANDITINYNQIAALTIGNITVTLASSTPAFQFFENTNSQNLPLI